MSDNELNNDVQPESTEIDQSHYLQTLGFGDGEAYPFDESGNYVEPTSEEATAQDDVATQDNDTQIETNTQDDATDSPTESLDFYFGNQNAQQKSTDNGTIKADPNTTLMKEIADLKAQLVNVANPQAQAQVQQPVVSNEQQKQRELITYSATKMSEYLSRGATPEQAQEWVKQDIDNALAEYEKMSASEKEKKELLERLDRIENEKKYDVAYTNNLFSVVNTEKWGSNDNFMQAIQNQEFGVMGMLNTMFTASKDVSNINESQYNQEFNSWFKDMAAKNASFLPELSNIVKAKKFMRDYPKLAKQQKEHDTKRALNTKKGSTGTKGGTAPANTGVKTQNTAPTNNIDAEFNEVMKLF